MTKDIRKYYYIMAGQVVYEYKGKVDSRNLNTLFTADHQHITSVELGQAQQALQIRFMKEIIPPSPDLKLMDVVMLSVFPLGHMNQEEYINEKRRVEINKQAQAAIEGKLTLATENPDGFPYS